MDVSRTVTEGIKVWLAGGGVLLALAWAWIPRRAAVGLLGALVLVAGVNYARFGPKTLLERVDAYDLVHYYLNAKYFDELGYYDLYPACILADVENGGPYHGEPRSYMAQDAAGHALRPLGHAIARGREVKEAAFTPERWSAFTADFLYLSREVEGIDEKMWRQLIQDHGYNGTTVWTTIARPIASAVPVQYVKALGWIDVGLLAVGLGAIGWAYGGVPALWAALFLFVTYSARWPTYSWAFLRYDYVAALMVGLALMRKGRTFWAGVVTGYAATLRLFPAMWLYGPGARGFAGLAGRVVHRHLLVFLGGFLLAVAALQGLALVSLGVEPARVHLENMEDHNRAEQLSSRRIGLALALPYRGGLLPKNLPKETKELIDHQKPLRFALGGLVLLVLGWGLRKGDDDEAYAYGFLPFFLLTTASYYYYVVRVPLIAMHAARLGERGKARHVAGLAMLLALEVFSNWAETRYPEHRVFLVGTLAWGLFAYAVTMALWTVRDSYRR